jgi:hypothetical protein
MGIAFARFCLAVACVGSILVFAVVRFPELRDQLAPILTATGLDALFGVLLRQVSSALAAPPVARGLGHRDFIPEAGWNEIGNKGLFDTSASIRQDVCCVAINAK